MVDKLKFLLYKITNNKKGDNMSKSNTVGSKYFRVGSQNQQILAKYWGTGKSFTTEDLTSDLDILSPGARLTELREAGFNVKAKAQETGAPGRQPMTYTIPRRRVSA